METKKKVMKKIVTKKMKDQAKQAMKDKCPKGYKRSGLACIKISGTKSKVSTAKTILGITF